MGSTAQECIEPTSPAAQHSTALLWLCYQNFYPFFTYDFVSKTPTPTG